MVRRFGRSLRLLDVLYKPNVDDWMVFDSLENDVVLSDWKGR